LTQEAPLKDDTCSSNEDNEDEDESDRLRKL
jgi:hypothetical protein